MTWSILIIIAGTIFLAGILISLGSLTGGGKKKNPGAGDDSGSRRKIVAGDGVDTKKLTYGPEKGAIFDAGQELYGTVYRGGGRRRVWTVRFENLGTGRVDTKTFQTRMAIGRKDKGMKGCPQLAIADDRMVSSVHCFLTGSQGVLMIEDAGSKNHTYLNNRRVEKPSHVSNGSVIRVGQTRLRVTYQYR